MSFLPPTPSFFAGKPKRKKLGASTIRREHQADKIDALGKEMVQKCSRCVRENISCRVHMSSGKCSACVRANCRECDISISEGDWIRLRKQRAALEEKMTRHLARMRELRETLQKLQEEEAKAWEKKSRLQKEMDLLETREAEALKVDDAAIAAAEESDSFAAPELPQDLVPILPWSNMEEVPEEFWSEVCFDPIPFVLCSVVRYRRADLFCLGHRTKRPRFDEPFGVVSPN